MADKLTVIITEINKRTFQWELMSSNRAMVIDGSIHHAPNRYNALNNAKVKLASRGLLDYDVIDVKIPI